MDDGEHILVERLQGVGRWTAEEALLHGLGRLHVLAMPLARATICNGGWKKPLDDAGARRRLFIWGPARD